MWNDQSNNFNSSKDGLQLIGEELRVALAMKEKGYRLVMVATDNSVTLYAKTISMLCNLFHDYPTNRFVTGYIWECTNNGEG